MRKIWLALFLVLTFGLTGCDSARNGHVNGNEGALLIAGRREFNVEAGAHGYLGVRYIEHMQEIFPNRLPFTDRELETAEWIAAILVDMGFAEEQIEMQTFRYDAPTSSWWGAAHWMIEMYKSMGYYEGLERIDYSQNVILTIPGQSAETIVIGAHYDGVGNPGISVNAAGVALLLESAYRMQDLDHYYTLQFVFFGAEEVGLIGAFYFVDAMTEAEIDNLVLMINADIIIEGPRFAYGAGFVEEFPENPMELMFVGWGHEALENALTRQIDRIADELNANHGTELVAKPQGIFTPSDQLVFLELGIPVVMLYGTHPVEYPDRFRGDELLHSPNDDLDFIMENFPGRIENALSSFGQLLERILMAEF